MGAVVRTCVGCRRRADRDGLLRLGAVEGRLRPAGGEAGRTAYLCPDMTCYERAVRRGAFTRALRAPVTIDEQSRKRVLDACANRRGGERHGQEEDQ